VNITYPIGWRGSEPIYFGALVGRPHLVDRQGHFDHAIALRLTYNVRQEKMTFGIGIFTTLPGVRMFCLYTCVQVTFTYIYQHSEQTPHEETFVNKLFREIIGPFLLERSTQVCAVLLYIVYMTLAISGCLNIKEGLDPRFLVRESFYLNNFYRLIHETFWYEGSKRRLCLFAAIKLTEDFYTLKAFRFQLGLRNYQTPTDHTNSCKLMREIASRYPDFNVTTFHEYYPFADQYLELKPSLVQNFTFGLLAMLAVTVVMIPDARAALAVVLCIASVNIGVLGFMTFWGVNLDSVSMITGATSTILGITVLTLVDAYIVLIFFKTVFLVILFSMLHGLLFLPVLLILLIPENRRREPLKADFHTPRAVFTCDSPQIPAKASFNDSCVKAASPEPNTEASKTVDQPFPAAEPSDEDVVKASVDRLTGKVVTPDDPSAR
ncbi:patched family protein, partial [Teladorsagia circumcincta]